MTNPNQPKPSKPAKRGPKMCYCGRNHAFWSNGLCLRCGQIMNRWSIWMLYGV